jgi:hypothetical protein
LIICHRARASLSGSGRYRVITIDSVLGLERWHAAVSLWLESGGPPSRSPAAGRGVAVLFKICAHGIDGQADAAASASPAPLTMPMAQRAVKTLGKSVLTYPEVPVSVAGVGPAVSNGPSSPEALA